MRIHMRKSDAALAICVGLALMLPGTVKAGEDCIGPDCVPVQSQKGISIKVVDMSMPDVLKMVEMQTGQEIVVAKEVRGRVSDILLSGTPDDMFDQLADHSNLDWFQYDGTYYVSRSQDKTTRLVPLNGLSAEAAQQSLQSSGLQTERANVHAVAGGGALSISGPVQYVALAEAILQVTEPSTTPYAETSVVRVRRGTTTSLEYYGQAGLAPERQVTPHISDTAAPEPEPEDDTQAYDKTKEEQADG